MKKYLFLLLVLLLPTFVFAKEDVYIDSVEVINHTDTAILDDNLIEYEGLALNLDMVFAKANDSIRLKVTLKNDSDVEYQIGDNISKEEEYITSQMSFDDYSNVLKSHSTKDITLTYTYPVELDPLLFQDGNYVENQSIKFDLSATDPVTNPVTNRNWLIPILLVIALGLVFVVRSKEGFFASLFILCLLPIVGWALETISIQIDSSATIVSPYRLFCYYDKEDQIHYFPLLRGAVTFSDYLREDGALFIYRDSFPFRINDNISSSSFMVPKDADDYNYCDSMHFKDANEEISDEIRIEDLIHSSEEGCYVFLYEVLDSACK